MVNNTLVDWSLSDSWPLFSHLEIWFKLEMSRQDSQLRRLINK